MGYAPPIVMTAANNDGSPWNPLWAHDNTLGPNIVPVALKTAGIAGLFAGAVYSAGSRQIKGAGGKMMVAGTAAYLHLLSALATVLSPDLWVKEPCGKSTEPLCSHKVSVDMCFTRF